MERKVALRELDHQKASKSKECKHGVHFKLTSGKKPKCFILEFGF
jgi:hypothetical protein